MAELLISLNLDRGIVKTSYQFISQFGGKGQGKGAIETRIPEGAAFDGFGNLYLESARNAISVFSSDGRFVRKIQRVFDRPHSFAFDVAGNLVVLDTVFNRGTVDQEEINRVRIMDPFGKVVSQLEVYPRTLPKDPDNPDSSEEEPYLIEALAVCKNHNLLLCRRPKIEMWSPSGGLLKEIGREHKYDPDASQDVMEVGELSDPVAVAVDFKTGNIVVLDGEHDTVNIFSESGEGIRSFGGYGIQEGQFHSVTGIAIDREGNMVVTDRSNATISIFDPQGNFLTRIGSPRLRPKKSSQRQVDGPSLIRPTTPLIDKDGNIWVIDGEMIRVFG